MATIPHSIDSYASLEYRCPTCNKLVVKGILLKGHVEFKCIRCRTFFSFDGPAEHGRAQSYLIISDHDGTIENCSASVSQYLGYEPGTLIGKNVDMLYADEARRATDHTIASRAHSFPYLRFDTVHTAQSGEDVAVTVTLRELAAGERAQLVRMVHCTPPMPTGLRERATFDMCNHSDFEAALDLHGNIIYADARACTLSGYAPEELIGKYVFDFMPPEEAARRRKNMHDLFAAHASYRVFDSPVRIKDGRIVVYDAFATPSYDDFGTLIGYASLNWLKEDPRSGSA